MCVHLFIRLVDLPCIPGFELSQLSCPGSSVGSRALTYRTQSVVGLNSTKGSFFFEKRESCPGCIPLSLLACHVHVCL